jgi:elongation factor G
LEKKTQEYSDILNGLEFRKKTFKAIIKDVRELNYVKDSVELYDGTYHDVDSSEIAFKIAASKAFQDGAKMAQPVLLEPMMKVEVVVPEEFIGDVTGDLSSKRGLVDGVEDRGFVQAISATVPLSEMFGYISNLRSMTSGRGNFTMEFARYNVVPRNVAEEIIKARA